MNELSLPDYSVLKGRLRRRLFFLCLGLECDVPILEAVFHAITWPAINDFFRDCINIGAWSNVKHIWENEPYVEISFAEFNVDMLAYSTLKSAPHMKFAEIEQMPLTDKEKIDKYLTWAMPNPNKFVRDKSPVRGPKKT